MGAIGDKQGWFGGEELGHDLVLEPEIPLIEL